MHTDPDAHLPPVWPWLRCKRALPLHGGCHRVARAREDDEEGVALRVDLAAVVPLEGLPQEPLVLSEHVAVALAELALEPRRPLDVREQERDRPARQLGRLGVCVVQDDAFPAIVGCGRAIWKGRFKMQQPEPPGESVVH